MTQHRPYPQDLDAERALLGGLLLDPSRVASVRGLVQPEDCYHRIHGALLAELYRRDDDGQPYDAELLIGEALSKGQAETFGGVPYMAGLTERYTVTMGLPQRAALIARHARARRLLERMEEASAALHAGGDPQEQASLLARTAGAIESEAASGAWVTLGDAMDTAIESIERRAQAGEPDGVSTTFAGLDGLGLRLGVPGKMVLLGARPAMGKSALALQWAEEVAYQTGQPVPYITLEMDAAEMAERTVARQCDLHAAWLRDGGRNVNGRLEPLTDEHFTLMRRAARAAHHSTRVLFDHAGGHQIDRLLAKVRALHRKTPIPMFVLDYIQLLDGQGENRTQQIGAISRAVKRFAREEETSALVVAQLNRGLESRADKRPLMSDLRESGQLEQDADVVMFVYRDEVYNPDTEDAGKAELIVRKNRGGTLGTARVDWYGSRLRFGGSGELV